MDRTAGLFIILILGLVIAGIVHIEGPEVVHEGDITIYEARVLLEGDEDLMIFCDVADTEFEKTKGLMGRNSIGENEGMIFVYDPPEEVTFWMKNTFIDLDIVFISDELEVIRVEEAEAGAGKMDNELELYSSGGPVAYVLEMNRGLSEEYGIGPGSSVEISV